MRSRDESPDIVQLDVTQNRVSITRDARNSKPRVSGSSFKILSPWSTSSLRVQYEAISIQSRSEFGAAYLNIHLRRGGILRGRVFRSRSFF